MRARLACIAGLSAVALLAAACGSSGGGGGGSTPSSGSGGSSSSAPAAAFKACLVSDTGTVNDKSFNQSAYEGATQAASASGGTITAQFLPSASPTDYAPNITSFINQKCGIIVTVGFLMGDATQKAAQANPDQKFAIVDFSYAQAAGQRERAAVQHGRGRLPGRLPGRGDEQDRQGRRRSAARSCPR